MRVIHLRGTAAGKCSLCRCSRCLHDLHVGLLKALVFWAGDCSLQSHGRYFVWWLLKGISKNPFSLNRVALHCLSCLLFWVDKCLFRKHRARKAPTYNWLLLYADTLSNNFGAELEEMVVASWNPTVIFLKVNKFSELAIYMYIYIHMCTTCRKSPMIFN